MSSIALKSIIINAITLALLDAGIEVSDMIFAGSSGYVQEFEKTPLIDMNYLEENKSKGEVIIGYLPKFEKLIYIETKNVKLQIADIDRLVDACMDGMRRTEGILRRCLLESFKEKVALQTR